jgi:hypothetical protein
MLPLPGSPVLDAGSNALIPAGVTTDQRGLPRISGSRVDIGAVELQVQPSGPAITSFTLVNADTDKDVMTLTDGATLDRSCRGD